MDLYSKELLVPSTAYPPLWGKQSILYELQVTGNEPKAKVMRRERRNTLRIKKLIERALVSLDDANYDQALGICLDALETMEKTAGRETTCYAEALIATAEALRATGRPELAELACREALAIRGKTVGQSHPDFASALEGLAAILEETGQATAARMHFLQAKRIKEAALGPNHPAVATSLEHLVRVYLAAGDTSVVTLALQAEAIKRKAFGDVHPEYASSLKTVADACMRLDQVETAGPLYEKILTARMSAFGNVHPKVAESLIDLARWHLTTGLIDRSIELSREALEIQTRCLSNEHPKVAETQELLGRGLSLLGRFDEAYEALISFLRIKWSNLVRSIVVIPDTLRDEPMEELFRARDTVLSLVSLHLSQAPGMAARAFDMLLLTQGLAAEAASVTRSLAVLGRFPALAKAFHELTQVRMDIARSANEGISSESTKTFTQRHDRALKQVSLERKLASILEDLDWFPVADHTVVAAALPPGTVLLEFVRSQHVDLFRQVASREECPARYLAFVLPAADPDRLAMVELGDAGRIDRLVEALRGKLTGALRDLGATAALDDVADESFLWRQLAATVLSPLVPLLQNCTHLVIAPDGALASIPFEALPWHVEGTFVIDRFSVSYLGTARDLLAHAASDGVRAGPPLIVANPDFDLTAEAPVPRNDPAGPDSSNRYSTESHISAGHFLSLPGAEREGNIVAALLGRHGQNSPQLLCGEDALEGRIKAIHSPAVLHFATHGFFSEARPEHPLPFLRAILTRARNPLLSCGLALAGANGRYRDVSRPADAEDGILTGLDVLGLDLRGTQLIVLSACNSGLGEVRAGHGIVGLRQAFLLAGARSVVMSLWKLPDDEACEFMTRFYRKLCTDQMPMADALRDTQLAMKDRYVHPMYWAAFILHGASRPLEL